MSLIDMHCEYKKCKHVYPITSHYIDDNWDILEANIAQSCIIKWMDACVLFYTDTAY